MIGKNKYLIDKSMFAR